MPRAITVVMMNTTTPTAEAAPMCPWELLNFRYISMLLVKIEPLGEPLPSVSRNGMSNICMPPTMTDEGVQAARRIRADHPHTGIVVLSQFAEPEFALALLENGSQRLGYLLKDRVAEPNELERAVRSVATGGSVVDPQIVDVLVQARTRRPSAVDRLTPRERDVMALVAQGYHNAAVAERLVVSEKAVAKHINSIFSKLDLGHDAESHHRVMAVLRWLSA